MAFGAPKPMNIPMPPSHSVDHKSKKIASPQP